MKRRLKRIHVNQHRIKANRKDSGARPCITVKCGGENVYAHEVAIRGTSKLVYRPEKPLSCGAVLWIETRAPVHADEELIE